MARSFAEAQRIFDRDYESDLGRIQPALEQLSQVFGEPGMQLLAPRRLRIERAEAEVGIAIRRARAFSFEVAVKPINLSFFVSHEMTEHAHSRIRISFEQIPAPDHNLMEQTEGETHA
jgi:hypothetical protein